jgi:hypothetical protein
MDAPLPCDPDEILSYEAAPSATDEPGGAIRVVFKDGTERTFTGEEAEQLVAVLGHVAPPSA